MSDCALELGDLKPGMLLGGLVKDQVVTIASVDVVGDVATLIYRLPDGSLRDEMIDASVLRQVHVVEADQVGPALDADPEEFRLAAEALRIKYAALYDPMAAVYSSEIDPLPHQIRAVYGDLLPKVPLRFLLADDPGAGKTIMAGLYVKEMVMRSAADRVVIVCPGSLAEQWRDELSGKFNLDFEVFHPLMLAESPSGNPFREHDRLIVRMDQVARSRRTDWLGLLREVRWDIAIVDEAHRMSAHFKNVYGEQERTARFRLGEVLASTAENLLLMTATPHSGKEEDFQLFMSLLDKDRFSGIYKPKLHRRTDTKGLMRRMVKEDLRTFSGKPLFPERVAQTVTYRLSGGEMELYRAVSEYVRSGMNAARKLTEGNDGRRGSSVGFALTILQRRLASSPRAIHESLKRRLARLEDLLDQVQRHPERARDILAPRREVSMDEFDEQWDETDEDAQGQLELELEETAASATAAGTIEELAFEIDQLTHLVAMSSRVLASHTDTKWSQLADILQHHVLQAGNARDGHKLIVFTEHRDTLEYLRERIGTLTARPESVVVIHGGMGREERKAVQERVVNDPDVRVLVATDAAGEGLNLQRADLMVNYDLPWNPNRIEQRFGRIHRIGQTRVCYLWNMVAKDTREGEVYEKLLGKIATMDKAYTGRLFNVLGDGKPFDGKSLRELMLDAIEYGDDPAVQARLDQVIDATVSQGLAELVRERSAHPDRYSTLDVATVRKLMERSRERKLQPGYVSAFFLPAFTRLGGRIRRRERGRWEITHVPVCVRRKAEQSNRRRIVSEAYERVTFDTGRVHIGAGTTDAVLLAPGNPLLDATVDVILDEYGKTLARGTVFIDRTDTQPEQPMLMMAVEQSIDDSQGETVSGHFDYLQVGPDGQPRVTQSPPYLDYEAPDGSELARIGRLRQADWVKADHARLVGRYVMDGMRQQLAALTEAKERDNRHVLDQVTSRLNAELDYWYGQYNACVEDERNGKPHKTMTSTRALKHIKDLEQRLAERTRELSEPVRFMMRPPLVRGTALVVPEHVIEPAHQAPRHAKDTREVDDRAIEKVKATEEALGRRPQVMPHNNKGYDIKSVDRDGVTYFIEVKGRIDLPGADTFTVTANEVAFAKTQGERHRLAIVMVSPDGPEHDRVRYELHAFDHLSVNTEMTSSYNEKLSSHWKKGQDPLQSGDAR